MTADRDDDLEAVFEVLTWVLKACTWPLNNGLDYSLTITDYSTAMAALGAPADFLKSEHGPMTCTALPITSAGSF